MNYFLNVCVILLFRVILPLLLTYPVQGQCGTGIGDWAMLPWLNSAVEVELGQGLQRLSLVVLTLIFLVLRGVSHLFLRDYFLIVKDAEITCQTMTHYYLILEQFMNLSLGLCERFRLRHMMWSNTWDPSSEVSYSPLWLHVLIVQHLPIVVYNWYSI